MKARILLLTACFLTASLFIAKASKTEPAFTGEPLAALPLQLGLWQGRAEPLDERVLSVLGVDDYVNRSYVSNTKYLGLYVGFYQTQRQGSTIHSPMNCLPGSGWNVVDRSYLRFPVASNSSLPKGDIQINRVLIDKGLERAVVLYWY